MKKHLFLSFVLFCFFVSFQSVKAASSNKIATGYYHTVYAKKDGSVWVWGDNASGQLGDGTLIDSPFPKQILAPGSGVIEVSAGVFHTVILKNDGSVWTWGDNAYGQLGDGSTIDSLVPKQIYPPGSNVVSVEAGVNYTMIIKQDGSVWGTGFNPSSQVGDGLTTNLLSFKQILPAGSNALSIKANSSHTILLKSDGSVWAWGENDYGQLCDGTQNHGPVPRQILPPGSGVSSIAGGTSFTMFTKNDGSVWACGRNTYGNFGDGTLVDSFPPKQILPAGSKAMQVQTGNFHTLLLKTDGSMWTWGFNDHGQLGDGTLVDSRSPKQVFSSGSSIVAFTGGSRNSVIIKSDGSVYSWGRNLENQLGDGTVLNRQSPIRTLSSSLLFLTSTSVSVLSSGLNIATLPTVTLGFGTLTLNGSSQMKTATLSKLSVDDFTGSASGWNVTVSANALTSGGNSLATGSLLLSRPSSLMTAGGGTSPSIPMAANAAIDGSSITIVSAAANQGMGSWDVNFPATTLSLTIPPTAHAGTYSSTITWTLSVGP